MPHVPSHIVSTGDVAQLTKPALNSASGEIRAAAVEALSSVLLIPDVMRAASESSGVFSGIHGS